MKEKKYQTFKEFYPYYLSEHSNQLCRRLHFIGTSLVFVVIFFFLATFHFPLLFLLPVVGYGFAWIGHFFFEKNKPATFEYPLYSLIGDFVMYKDICLGKVKIF